MKILKQLSCSFSHNFWPYILLFPYSVTLSLVKIKCQYLGPDTV